MSEQYTLPKNWRWVKLGEVCEIDSNQILPDSTEAKSLPYIGLEHIESETGKITGKIEDDNAGSIHSATFRFDDRHVLYGKLRPYLNKVAIPNFEGRCSTELLPLLPNRECDRIYLAWLLRRMETIEEAMGQKTGSRMPRANMKELFKMQIPIPFIDEQRRIAAKIQELMQEVKQAKESCEKQLEAAQALPSAYLREVFDSPEARKWERKRLGEACESDSGVWGDEPDASSECYFVLRSNNIRERKMVFDEIAIRKIEAKYLESKLLKRGDILVTTSSGSRDLLGKSAIFTPPDNKLYLFSNFIMRLRANPVADSFYLYFYLQSFEAKKILQLLQDTTTGLRNLDRKEFLNQPVPLPPLSEQQRIVTDFKQKMTEAENLQSIIRNQQSTISALPQSILRKAFRGEI